MTVDWADRYIKVILNAMTIIIEWLEIGYWNNKNIFNRIIHLLSEKKSRMLDSMPHLNWSQQIWDHGKLQQSVAAIYESSELRNPSSLNSTVHLLQCCATDCTYTLRTFSVSKSIQHSIHILWIFSIMLILTKSCSQFDRRGSYTMLLCRG